MSIALSNSRELVAAACLLVQAGSGAGAAAVLSRRFGPDRLERALAGTTLFFVQAVGVSIVLGMLGILALPSVLIGHVVVLGAVLVADRRWERPDPAAAAEGWSAWGLAAVGLGAALLALSVANTLRSPLSEDFDTREYHITNLAHWLQDGSIWNLPYAGPGSITATHPGNGELFGTWLSLPTHGDELAYLTPTAFGALAVLAVAVIARQLGGRRATASGALLGIAVLAAPIYFVTQTKSIATDLPSAAPLAAALALLLVARSRPSRQLVLLTGAALGLGLGAKYTALVPGVLIAVAALVLLPSRRWWAWLAPGLAVLALPWFLRNLLQTGNPLFPLDLPGFEGGETPVDVLDQSMLDHLVDGKGEIIEEWGRLVARLIGPVVILVVAGWVLAWRQIADRRAAITVTVLAIGSVGAQLALPYSGGGPTGLTFLIASSFRYGLVAMLIGAGLAAGALPARLSAPLAAVATAWGLWRIDAKELVVGIPIGTKLIAGALVAGAAIAGAVWFCSREEARFAELAPSVRRRVAAVALAAVLVAALGGAAAAFHREDRGDELTALERLLQPFGFERPALAMGVDDMRSVLGPRLERHVFKVDRGGHANEIPFVDVDQVRAIVLGEERPAQRPELADELTAAIDSSPYDLLVLDRSAPLGVPLGWEPSDRWCLVGRVDQTEVYAAATAYGLGADDPCPAP